MIGPLDSELLGLECRPLKNKAKNIGKIYSPFGKFAELAKTASYGDRSKTKKKSKPIDS